MAAVSVRPNTFRNSATLCNVGFENGAFEEIAEADVERIGERLQDLEHPFLDADSGLDPFDEDLWCMGHW